MLCLLPQGTGIVGILLAIEIGSKGRGLKRVDFARLKPQRR